MDFLKGFYLQDNHPKYKYVVNCGLVDIGSIL